MSDIGATYQLAAALEVESTQIKNFLKTQLLIKNVTPSIEVW